MRDLLLLVFYPVALLVIVLGWFMLIKSHKSDTTVSLKGLGLSIQVTHLRRKDDAIQEGTHN